MPGSLVIINPAASQARNASILAALTERAVEVLGRRDGTAPRLVETAAAAEVRPLVREAMASSVAAVIGVGGDGTVRDIAAELAGSGIPLGIVPAGTGNQVASVLAIPRTPAAAIDALESARATRIDLGEVTVGQGTSGASRTTFVLGCGAGFDAELMATTSASLKRRVGAAAYFVQAARLALRLSATPVRVTLDGEVMDTTAAAALIGNMGQLVPGRLGLRLPIDPADGLLDLFLVRGRDPLDGLLGLTDQVRRSELGGSAGDRSIRLRGRAIAIEPQEPMPLEVDGDHVSGHSLSARVLPGALQVLVPSA